MGQFICLSFPSTPDLFYLQSLFNFHFSWQARNVGQILVKFIFIKYMNIYHSLVHGKSSLWNNGCLNIMWMMQIFILCFLFYAESVAMHPLFIAQKEGKSFRRVWIVIYCSIYCTVCNSSPCDRRWKKSCADDKELKPTRTCFCCDCLRFQIIKVIVSIHSFQCRKEDKG